MKHQGTQLFILLLIVLVQGGYSMSSMCRNAVAPPSQPRGVNQVDRTSTTPLFQLHMAPLENERNPRELTAYKISISIEKGERFRISQATLAVSNNGSCGPGDFDFRAEDYVEIVQDYDQECPRLIQAKRKTLVRELNPLIWVPPTCGCITMRMLIVVEESGAIYYAENEEVIQGPLVKTVCFQQKQHISREDRLESLCHVIDKHSSSEILSRSQFQRHREMEARWMDRLGMEMALELRRNDAKTCCSKIRPDQKLRCFDNARRQRIDRFCEDGVPDIPFRTFRRNHMRTLEKSCCFILGEFRYKCFAKNSQIAAKAQDTTLFDYSMDASDVVNDLSDFGSREHLDEFLRPVEFGSREEIDESVVEENDEEEEMDMKSATEEDENSVDEDFDGGNINSKRENDEEDSIYATVPTKIGNRRVFLQRSPPNPNTKGRIDQQTTSLTSPTSFSRSSAEALAKPTALSKKELKRKMNRKSKSRRNSKESSSSIERKRQRFGGSSRRKTSRRGSAERRDRMRKIPRIPVEDNYRRTSSQERKSVFYTPTFDESKGRGSRERSRAMKASRRDKSGGISGRSRRPMSLDKDLGMPTQYGFDDQEDSNMDRTLKKLQKRMKRLKLLNLCCQAGVDIGHQVYGGIGQVTDECRHGSDKFVSGIDIRGKTRRCAIQFVDCCLEEAKKGLTMTSQEFIENTEVGYWNNNQEYDPGLVGRVLSQRGRRPARPAPRRPGLKNSREVNVKAIERKHLPKQLPDAVKEKKFLSKPQATNSRSEDKNTEKFRQTSVKEQGADIPKSKEASKIDEPNQNIDQGLNTTKHALPTARLDTEKLPNVEENSMTGKVSARKGVTMPTKAVLKRIVYVEFDDRSVDPKTNNKKSDGSSKTLKEERKDINEQDFLDTDINELKKDNNEEKQFEKNVKKAFAPKNLTPTKERDIGVATNEDKKEKPGSEREISQKTKDVSEIQKEENPRTTSHRKSSTGNVHTSSISTRQHSRPRTVTPRQNGRDSRVRTRGRQSKRHRSYNGRKSAGKRRYKSRGIALDSREMAERNTKKYYMDALDSREMADQYISNKHKRTNWYRKGLSDYRYATSPLGKGRRKYRFGK